MRLARPARLHSALARAEMVTWTLLLLGMALKHGAGLDRATQIGGGVHGFVFLAYALVTVLIAIDHRWGVRDLLVGLGSAVLPYATVPFERSAQRRGLVAGDWRLLHDAARGPLERLVGWALRHPVAAGVAAVVALAVVFSGLLVTGPPTRWFA
ncbi:DUF3817 domain-containing protein [Arsenicicoccus dermatophilus]|uniref:DUF3817 domain-containing protein n=1 Tax=Arsenicicoccus dermatophilus TaxID=1076331 RepID=UPI001F4C9568|nr:DUF3817 domain-containing protein [Arsenicicoccus dermatophilus]